MLVLAVAYFATSWLGLTQATIAGAASPVWPATGVSLAGLYLLGVSRWPAVFVASAGSILCFGIVPPQAALAMGVGNTLEAVLGALLLRRLGFSPTLGRIQDVLALTSAAGACTLASVLMGTLSLVVVGGPHSWNGLLLMGWVWWLGNAMGALVVGSAVMLLSRSHPEPRWREALVLTGLTLVVGFWAFSGGHQGSPLAYAQVFLLFPLGVWAALRFGSHGAALSTLLIAAMSIWGTIAGHGPFISRNDGRTVDLLELQLFLAVVAFTGLLLAAARVEQGKAHSQLELLATAVRSVREGVLISTVHPGEGPRLVYANESFREMVGWRHEELVGRTPCELFGGELEPEAQQRLEVALREGDFFRGEVMLAHKDGSRVVHSEMQLSPVRGADGRVSYFVATHRDVTAQKQLQAKLVSAERIAAVGTLAAGVGHEINNPLSYLLLNLDEAEEGLAKGPQGLAEARARLESAREGAERIRVIVRDLKVFSRQEGEERAMLDVNEVVVPALRMAAPAVRPRARLVEEFGRPPRVMGSEARLGQVMLNLLVNALQAIPEGSPELHEVRVRTGSDDSGRALVEVSDTGCGMSPTVLARIFDPFFTTKSSAEGTGLGLAICQQIVQAHGGELRVRSEEGKGSVFTILLPSAEARPSRTPVPVVVPSAPSAPVATQRRRILIIDDEPRLAQSMRMLIEPSHDVSVTTRGAEALAWVDEGQRFDLVLCDLQMPGTTGMDVYSHLRQHAPELAERLVFISGGAYTQATRDFVRSVRNRILEKPVRPDELLATIDEALASMSAA
ncbi:MASE1 domain-containing protein [Vitiosangium sp. GDMCC 1.1324]|uniref:MASE1 domain-containing protein n=1 Tax=Vitiosangium sp. (strain GDMCC 1.1324) TaxID=2138576 RepID=UPI000D34EC2B|nr:MASE1 domain-containing protein [Vitiosangium sp. GDMCC 1.1324]PTL83073.1 histidine kinase [Vitiosangium sp. GDMCC 1.1324]